MSGKLKNRTRRALTFNLTTKVAPIRHLFDRRLEQKDGTVKTTQRRLVLPDSVTVLAGKLSDSLPDGAPHCPEVAAAIARRDVEWIPDPEKVAEPEKPAEPEKASTEDDGASSPRSRRRAG